MANPFEEQQEPGSGEEFVIAIRPDTGEPVAISAKLARYNGYEIVQSGFGSRGEALGSMPGEGLGQQGGDLSAGRSQQATDMRAKLFGTQNAGVFNHQPTPSPMQQRQVQPQIDQAGGELQARRQEEQRKLADFAFRDPNQTMPGSMRAQQGASSLPLPDPSDSLSRSNPLNGDPQLRNPVDQYTGGVFEGTWAEDSMDNNQFLNLIGGKMDENMAVHNVLQSQGMDSHTSRNFLEDEYLAYQNIHGMANPGEFLDPTQYYAQAGQHLIDMTTPGGEINSINYQGLWDNQFSDAYSQQLDTMGEGQDNPEAIQKDAIVANLASLSPYMGEERASMLVGQVEREYTEYMASGYNAQMNFVEWLRQRGAEDWT